MAVPANDDLHSPLSRTRKISMREWWAIVALLLVAFALRTIDLTGVPPGLHNDEVVAAKITERVTNGQFAIFFTGDTGSEPFHYYYAALFMRLWGNSVFALRLPSVVLSMIAMCVIWALGRRLFGPIVALTALAGFAIVFWPLVFGRIVSPVSMMVPLASLSAYFFWRASAAVGRRATAQYGLSGLWLGLALISYTAARILPFIFVAFGGYVLIAHRSEWRRWWKAIAVVLMVAASISAPMFIFLIQNPDAKRLDYFGLNQPLTELSNGKPGPVIATSLRALGMFSFVGDPLPYYDVPHRPVLEPIGSLLLLLGLLIACRRWRQVEYAFVVLWLFVSLVPSMLSAPAPNYTRTLGAQTTLFIVVGIAVAALLSRYRRTIVYSAVALLFVGNLVWTVHDYFTLWPSINTVRFWHQTGLKAVADAVQATPDSSPVILCLPDFLIDEREPWWNPAWQHMHFLLHRPDISLRYNNCVDSMIFVNGPARYAFPDAASVDALKTFAPFAALQAAGLDYEVLPDRLGVIVRADANGADRLSRWLNRRIGEAEAFPPTITYAPETGSQSAQLPISFASKVDFLGYTLSTASPKRGSAFELVTYWRVKGALPAQLSQFTHVLNANGDIVTQVDRLMLTSTSLQPDDIFAQVHHVALPGNLKAGKYALSIGLYTQTDNARLPIIQDGQPRGDRLFLKPIEVTK